MSKIKKIQAFEIFDSRGYPTVEVFVTLESGHIGHMMVPSGASTGKFEAWELRDGGNRYRGKGVKKAVENVNNELSALLIGKKSTSQEEIDQLMIDTDGTPNKSRLGANAILGVSFAIAHAASAFLEKPLYKYLSDKYLYNEDPSIPLPMANIISGGLHAGGNIDIQDFLVIPTGATNYSEALEIIFKIYFKTQDILLRKGYQARLLADEGGYGPELHSNEEALGIITEAINESGLIPLKDVSIALDVAATHFYNKKTNMYNLDSEQRQLTSTEMIDLLTKWVDSYPIISIEDGLDEEDWEGWQELTNRLGDRVQLVGDDLFTTDPIRIEKGHHLRAGNGVLVKMNQIGTLTETVKAVNTAKNAGFNTIVSARSGETEDATLADLSVGLNSKQIKIGSVAGSSRLAKYNQLLRIDQQSNLKFSSEKVLNLRRKDNTNENN